MTIIATFVIPVMQPSTTIIKKENIVLLLVVTQSQCLLTLPQASFERLCRQQLAAQLPYGHLVCNSSCQTACLIHQEEY